MSRIFVLCLALSLVTTNALQVTKQTLEDEDEGKMRDSPSDTRHDLSLL